MNTGSVEYTILFGPRISFISSLSNIPYFSDSAAIRRWYKQYGIYDTEKLKTSSVEHLISFWTANKRGAFIHNCTNIDPGYVMLGERISNNTLYNLLKNPSEQQGVDFYATLTSSSPLQKNPGSFTSVIRSAFRTWVNEFTSLSAGDLILQAKTVTARFIQMWPLLYYDLLHTIKNGAWTYTATKINKTIESQGMSPSQIRCLNAFFLSYALSLVKTSYAKNNLRSSANLLWREGFVISHRENNVFSLHTGPKAKIVDTYQI